MADSEAPPVEVLPWLKALPTAPEYHPTPAEFKDPISYIDKIEPEASKYGICKIVPPVPPPPKKSAAANLARSLKQSRCPPAFATRLQQVGFCPRRPRPAQRPVWQSGESYTLPQFEAKAKGFERAQLKRVGRKSLSVLEAETAFWRACAGKPFAVEYANDIPGSAFPDPVAGGGGETVGESAWNMRRIAKLEMSPLRFMREEVPGVTSPMVYVGMMFSWFAWHVEDHDLHSLNYLHFGAGKTWYGVPRDAGLAFEEVVRVHGYGEEVNPLVTFAILSEKTTVISPEVLLGAGVPCCRLVQNAGDFVVTFPGAYHTGFSHGFNCAEASNIATPGWLSVAKEAARRRASISYPPMLSHIQLLYNLALTLCSSGPKNFGSEMRSSRLKDKKQRGEMGVKQLFTEDMIQNNELLHALLKGGYSCVILPQSSFELPLSSTSRLPLGYKKKVKSMLPPDSSSHQEAVSVSDNLCSSSVLPGRNKEHKGEFWSASGDSFLLPCEGKQFPSLRHGHSSNFNFGTSSVPTKDTDCDISTTVHSNELFDDGLLSCVTCGLSSFVCVALIQPTEAASKHIMSTSGSVFNDYVVGSGINYGQNLSDNASDILDKEKKDGLVDIFVQSGSYQLQVTHKKVQLAYGSRSTEGVSALALLASAYGDSSDSDEELSEHKSPVIGISNGSEPQGFSSKLTHLDRTSDKDTGFTSDESSQYSDFNIFKDNDNRKSHRLVDPFNSAGGDGDLMAIPVGVSHAHGLNCKETDGGCHPSFEHSGIRKCDIKKNRVLCSVDHSKKSIMDPTVKNQAPIFCQKSHRDISRMHIFCLEHAVEVERQLHPVGGADILLVCHPDYHYFKKKAEVFAKGLSIDHDWKSMHLREASTEDERKIQTAIDDDEAVPGNGDWTVKLGINLYYSSSLSKSPIYSKQMPYNSLIYKLFGQDFPYNSPTKLKVYTSKRSQKHKKIVVIGKWCGKVWMSNQVHPYLVRRQNEELNSGRHFDIADDANEVIEQGDDSILHAIPAEKYLQKRKFPFEVNANKKAKHQQSKDSSESEEELPIKFSLGNKRVLHSRLSRRATPVARVQSKKSIISDRKLDKKDEIEGGPSTRLRKRPLKYEDAKAMPFMMDREVKKKKPNKFSTNGVDSLSNSLEYDKDAEYQCDMEACTMGFTSKHDLILHKKNLCLVKGCGKKFFSHKYMMQHRRVHMDDRPLKCPWKGCKMAFKWAWARTEHIRVHTGARPYVCKEAGCGQTFRFVSDFSRHKRKTGHSKKKKVRG